MMTKPVDTIGLLVRNLRTSIPLNHSGWRGIIQLGLGRLARNYIIARNYNGRISLRKYDFIDSRADE